MAGLNLMKIKKRSIHNLGSAACAREVVGESRPNRSGEAETLRTGLQIPSGMGG